MFELENNDPFQSEIAFPAVPQPEMKAALDRLASRAMLAYDTNDTEQAVLTSEGQQIADEGSHEYKLWEAVKQSGKLSLKDPLLATPSAKPSMKIDTDGSWMPPKVATVPVAEVPAAT